MCLNFGIQNAPPLLNQSLKGSKIGVVCTPLTDYQLTTSDIVDEIVSKYSLPSVNENSIASFVKLRNNKTHSGTVEWGESAKIYTPLFAIVYASFFKYIKLPDEVIKSTLLQIF